MRESILRSLHEAAELEHDIMCSYLYAAFSLKTGDDSGLGPEEAAVVARWRRAMIGVAIGEMRHLTAVWNITSALGGVPRFGRGNFPIEDGYLPASIVVELAPFDLDTLQHFIHLERPATSIEPDGRGFARERHFARNIDAPRVTPMGTDYDTVGAFYAQLRASLADLVELVGEAEAFCGDPALQMSSAEVDLAGATPVTTLESALAALDLIVFEGEGAPTYSATSHFQEFVSIHDEYRALLASNPTFAPAFPVARNPVLRRPPNPAGRVWLENEEAAAAVDVANASYGLMLRLLAYSYSVPSPRPEKALAVELGIAMMHAVSLLADHAARLPANPSTPDCHAGVSFTALRDAAPLPEGPAARRFFVERFSELASAASDLAPGTGGHRVASATTLLVGLARRAERELLRISLPLAAPAPAAAPASAPPLAPGVEVADGGAVSIHFDPHRCIHSRICVTRAPKTFLADVAGPWLHPDATDPEALVAVLQQCPSGALQYVRHDGRADEQAPPVNLLATQENGPYAVRADVQIDGQPIGYRVALCRCGASARKPFCDGSHRRTGFLATGEPATVGSKALAVRDGVLAVAPRTNGPLEVRGNLEITSGTGRVVARVQTARLCRCGASAKKPFCDGSHVRVGFTSDSTSQDGR